MLAVVLLSRTLFFAATGSRFGSSRARSVMVALAGGFFVGTAVWIALLPEGMSV